MDNNETPETAQSSEFVSEFKNRLVRIAKRLILPAIAVGGIVGAVALSNHGSRLNELEESIYTDDDDLDGTLELEGSVSTESEDI